MSAFLEIDAIGFDDAAEHLHEVADNIVDWSGAADEIFTALEEGERVHFSDLRGRYVRTGRTLDSLTRRVSPDAIRNLHGTTVDFGTRVPYVKYLHKPPVVVMSPDTQRNLADLILAEIVSPIG